MPAHLREQVERLRSTDGFERYDAAMQLSRMGKDALPALPVLLEMLKDRDYVWTIYPHGQYVCSAATDALEQIGEEAVKPLVTVLETGGAGAREEAAIALGCMKNPEGIDALVSVLHDRNSPARTAAAVALAIALDTRTIPTLIEMLKDKNASIRMNCVVALSEMQDETAHLALIQALEDDNSEIRSYVAGAFQRLKTIEAADQLAQVAYNDLSLQVRLKAAVALNSMGDDRALQPLVTLLLSTDDHIADQALAELERSASVDVIASDMLIGALGDENEKIRLRAVQGLGVAHTDDAFLALLRLIKGHSLMMRRAALRALGYTGDERAIKFLAEALHDEDDGVVFAAEVSLGMIDSEMLCLEKLLIEDDARIRRSAARSLGWSRSLRAVKPLLMALKDRDPDVRRDAALSLGMIEDPRIDPLIRLMTDADPRVRCQAAATLGQIGASRAVGPLAASLADEAAYCSIVEALASIKDPRAVGPILESLKTQREPTRVAAAISALGELKSNEALSYLLGSLNDAESEVRLRAVEAIGQIRNPAAIPALISALEDGNAGIINAARKSLGEITGRDFGDDPAMWMKWWNQNKQISDR